MRARSRHATEAAIPLGRLGQPNDLVGTVLFVEVPMDPLSGDAHIALAICCLAVAFLPLLLLFADEHNVSAAPKSRRA